MQQPHVVRLETRPPNLEGVGEIKQRDLVRNALRMRPDRIIVGEVRGAEALDMLQAMNTGHEGSLTTIHANDTRDALARLEMMVMMAGFEMPVPVIRQYIASAIELVVQIARLKGGERKIMKITEILGIKGNRYVVRDLFGFRQTGMRDGVGGRRVLRNRQEAQLSGPAADLRLRPARQPLRRAHPGNHDPGRPASLPGDGFSSSRGGGNAAQPRWLHEILVEDFQPEEIFVNEAAAEETPPLTWWLKNCRRSGVDSRRGHGTKMPPPQTYLTGRFCSRFAT